jgi:hypothetical protein
MFSITKKQPKINLAAFTKLPKPAGHCRLLKTGCTLKRASNLLPRRGQCHILQ